MRHTIVSRKMICWTVLAVLLQFPQLLHAQKHWKPNFVLGSGIGFNQGRLADLADTSGNFVLGGGIDFNRKFGVSLEYQFYNIEVKDSVMLAAQIPQAVAMMHSLTLNPIYRFKGRRFIPYVTGGGGWYRSSVRSQTTILVPGTVCNPAWLYWGIPCVSGLVPTTLVLDQKSSDAFGVDVGGGLVFKFQDEGIKFFTELRYHHAYNKNVAIDALPLTFGVRW